MTDNVWRFEVDACELILEDLKNMIKCKLIPTVEDDIFVFSVRGNVELDTNAGKIRLKLIDNRIREAQCA